MAKRIGRNENLLAAIRVVEQADRDRRVMGSHHYNYEIQAWIEYGRVRGCAHPEHMKSAGCCNGYRYAGETESAAVAAERKTRKSTGPRPRLDFVNHRGE